MKTKVKITRILFILLIITSILPYIIPAIYAVVNKQYILWEIQRYNIQIGNVCKIFPYFKDVLAVLLFVILFISSKQTKKIVGAFMAIIFYGALILFGHQNYNIGYIIAGIRMFLYFFVTIMYFYSNENNEKDFKNIFRVLISLLIIEFTIVFIQVLYSGQIQNFGSGGYRFCGTFGNAISMGNFTVAANLYILFYTYIKNVKSKNINYIYIIIILLLSIASGTRTAIFLNLFITYMYWCTFSLSKLKISRRAKITCMVLIILSACPIAYKFFIDRIGRGAMMISGGIRLGILQSFFNVQNFIDLLNLVIGYGVGFTTNSAALLNLEETFIVDGTYTTILAQFGLIGLVVFIYLLGKSIQNLWKYCNKNINIVLTYFITIILVMISQNIFEQIAMIILVVVEYFMIKNIGNKREEGINK